MAAPTVPNPQAGAVYAGSFKGDNATIWSAADAPGSALDADFQAGTIIDTGKATALACTFKYDGNGSAAAGNSLEFFFLVSNASSAPAIGDDEWAVIAHPDVGDPTAADQADSMPSGVDVTVTPDWGGIVTRPGYFSTETGATSSTEKLRFSVVVNVRYWKYIVLLAKEAGEPANAGTLVVDAALIIG